MSRPIRISPAGIDSLTVAGARAAIDAVAIVMVLAPLALDLVAGHDVADWALQIAAVGAVGAASLALVLGNAPRRYPFGPAASTAVLALTTVAAALDALSRAGDMSSARFAWGPVSLAALLVVLGALRPAIQIVPATIVSVVAVGLAIVAVGGGDDAHGHPLAGWIMAAGPPLACGLASGAYSATIARGLQRSTDAQREQREQDAQRLRAQIAEHEREERVALVEAQAAPFLRAVLEAGEISPVVAHRARRLADQLRDALMHDDEGWLDPYVDALGDPLGLARRFDDRQRLAIAGFAEAARQRGRASSPPPRLTARTWRADGRVVLQLRVAGDADVARDQRLALVRQVFPGSQFHGGAGAATLTVSTAG